ncbi:DHA2 family efflux MFS transporter permease subunit [Bartonella krasnovii]|uniref:DHA2 family efflux MFS transporter permease subunit n=1 Tax=Bartonella krasnovii TaxID=2267275 RepID=A0A5B9D2F6_9HYPH|nr:DHA2 family efflux MFS transporter permease subunit [Bartonella krasnovii]QEE12567.1 DHA2 family efflux MFS transporter permease subunit [Bartonella krasnovii]UNF28670.1 DHA2 family efflux MFS transporter permease subunit [Bartonella krasnovii]UNF35046.1 DHA2 family efflux MFS transporter permease subunit [Bartonella krasnovii]UNF36678.1 DHA2 family efflux MFS transporter permease subunit [Bartonella krasnovii]UNF38304.1 DHA2 family efflux MFS transporter permease subunit [Bartonella krasno
MTPSIPKPIQSQERIEIRNIVIFIVMAFGMFMAILDIQIVASSLAEVQAGLAASSEEISWVQTSYLIAEVIMLPLSGFLGRLLSTRVFFTISAIGFTVTSILCATAASIGEMIIYRALQGFIGGGIIPSVFVASYVLFPPSKRPVVVPIVGLVATLAPTIGPTVGGYLCHLLSWHWLFLINVPFGIIISILAWKLINFDKANPTLMAKFDWLGLISMAVFLGTLEYVLEEGARHDWLNDRLIRNLFIIMILSAILFFWRAFTAKEPIVDLTAFSNFNFSAASIFSFSLGIGLYGLTYLYPVYLSQIRQYDALMIGETLFLSGFVMLLTAPLAGYLSARIDARLMMAIGLFGFAIGTWMASSITDNWDFWQLFWPQVFRGASVMLCMVPVNNIALGTLPPERMQNASGLFNLTRNLGGAVGLAIISTLMTKRTDFHYGRIAETLNYANRQATEMLSKLSLFFKTETFDSYTLALSQLSGIARIQAMIMALSDIFFIITIIFGFLTLMTIFLKKIPPLTDSPPSH